MAAPARGSSIFDVRPPHDPSVFVAPNVSRSLCLSMSLLLTMGVSCLAQEVAPNTALVSSANTSTSLPEEPAPRDYVRAQSSNVPHSPLSAIFATPEGVTLRGTPKRLLSDQKAVWTSPLRLRPQDAEWLLPLSVATGLLIGSDQHTMTSAIHINADGQKKASTISTGGVVALGAVPAGAYVWSLFNHAPQARETGILTGEALANSLAINQVLKLGMRRDRPLVNNASGNFFSSSFSEASFPSNHAVAAWTIASVVGEEYPGWLTRTAVYSLASAVSVSRVLAEKHFPSDVLVGSATGWLIGHYVYRAHHDYSLTPFAPEPAAAGYRVNPIRRVPATVNGATTTPLSQSVAGLQQNITHLPPDPLANRIPLPFDPDPDTIGSTNVPMDSWIYPALERLAALGLIPGQSVSIRPWTRQECLRQLKEAEELAGRRDDYSPGLLSEARRLMTDLHHELADEPTSYEALSLESVYARYGTIAGPALNDSFHFGQTWWNDFGRPQGRGSNFIAGYSLRAHHGRLFFYDRQELQHGPGNPAQSTAINELINTLDRIQPQFSPNIPLVPAHAAYDRQRPIELYAGLAFTGNALTFGKQELYWGPTTMGPLSFSSNAEPTYNLRFVATRPHPLPLLPSLGTYRFDIVLGKLSGHSYPARPWFNGQKIDFNFGDNLELSFTRWSVFWGVGHPITFHTFKQNIFSFNSTGSYVGNGASPYGDRNDPGDRKSNFDFRYKLPFMRKMVTLYADAYSDDDPNPIDAPRRAVWNPGIYFARLPFLPHMDLRVEAVSSTGLATDFGGQHFFMNNQYLDSNTNKGFLLGNAIGRDARAIEGRTSYWFSARTKVEAGYRQNKGSSLFLPGGSTITDGFVNSSVALNRHWTAQIFAQYERFLIPSYMKGSQHNTSGWFQITWNPELHLKR
jgi:membrane-associated phospholipid phosphatase